MNHEGTTARHRPGATLAVCIAIALGAVAMANAASAMVQPQGRKDVRIGEVIAGSPLWSEWSRRYVKRSGRVVDTAAHGASHSEGQGYGMLLAVAAGDRAAFDQIWRWTHANLAVRSDHLLAWRWDPNTRAVSDRNNATDGDILVAWALAEAADLWNSPEYVAAASAIAEDVSRLLVVDAIGVGPVLLPASFGFTRADQTDGPVVNLSYWIFPAFSRLAQLAPKGDWDRVRRAGLAIVDAIQSQAPASVTNWTALGDSKIAPARRFPAKVGYDAVRIPLYLAFAPHENAERLAGFGAMFPPAATGLPIVDLRSGEVDEIAKGRGYGALAALRDCVVGGQPFPDEFYRLGGDDAYYPATLHALALVAALIAHGECLDPVEASRLQPLGWTRRVAGDLSLLHSPRTAASQSPPQSAPKPSTPVAAAMITPSDDGDDDAAANRFWRVGAPIGALLTLIGFIVLSRQSGAPTFVNEATPPVLRERSPAPRNLPDNPFHAERGERALEERLDIAARASREWRRTAAVACFRLADYDDIVAAEDSAAAQRVMASLVAALSSCIRKSDAVALLGPNEIVVCLSLIADEIDLASVGRRFTKALRAVHPIPGAEENLFGLALYEMDSTGARCLAQAREAAEAMRPSKPPTRKAQAERPTRARAPRRKKPAKAKVGA